MPLYPPIERGTAQRDALIDRAIVPNLGGLSDHYPHAMINKDTPSDLGARVNLNSGRPARELRHESSQPTQIRLPETMRQPVQRQSVHAGIARQDLQFASGSGITRVHITPP